MLVIVVDNALFSRVAHRGSDSAHYKRSVALMPRRLQLGEGLEVLVRNFNTLDRRARRLLADVKLVGLLLAVCHQLVAIACDEPHATQRRKDTGAEHCAKADVKIDKVVVDNATAFIGGWKRDLHIFGSFSRRILLGVLGGLGCAPGAE